MSIVPLGYDMAGSVVALKTSDYRGPTPIYSRDQAQSRQLALDACSLYVHNAARVAVFTSPAAKSRYVEVGCDTVLTQAWELPIAMEAIFNHVKRSKDNAEGSNVPALIIFDTWADVSASAMNAEFVEQALDLSRAHPLFHVLILAESSAEIPRELRAAASSVVFLGLQDKRTTLDYSTELKHAQGTSRHENNFACFSSKGSTVSKALKSPLELSS